MTEQLPNVLNKTEKDGSLWGISRSQGWECCKKKHHKTGSFITEGEFYQMTCFVP